MLETVFAGHREGRNRPAKVDRQIHVELQAGGNRFNVVGGGRGSLPRKSLELANLGIYYYCRKKMFVNFCTNCHPTQDSGGAGPDQVWGEGKGISETPQALG